MQYMLLIHSGDAPDQWDTLSEDQQKAIMGEYLAISQSPGVTDGNQLQPAETATTVRVDDGRTLTTDGPFAETKEALGGYALGSGLGILVALLFAAWRPLAGVFMPYAGGFGNYRTSLDDTAQRGYPGLVLTTGVA